MTLSRIRSSMVVAALAAGPKGSFDDLAHSMGRKRDRVAHGCAGGIPRASFRLSRVGEVRSIAADDQRSRF